MLKKELETLRIVPWRFGPSHRELKINELLVDLYHKEELMWKQRSRVEWLRAGDKITCDIFIWELACNDGKNLIKLLVQEDGNTTEDIATMKSLVNDFIIICILLIVQDMQDVLDKLPVKVTTHMNAELNTPYMTEEVKRALLQNVSYQST